MTIQHRPTDPITKAQLGQVILAIGFFLLLFSFFPLIQGENLIQVSVGLGCVGFLALPSIVVGIVLLRHKPPEMGQPTEMAAFTTLEEKTADSLARRHQAATPQTTRHPVDPQALTDLSRIVDSNQPASDSYQVARARRLGASDEGAEEPRVLDSARMDLHRTWNERIRAFDWSTLSIPGWILVLAMVGVLFIECLVLNRLFGKQLERDVAPPLVIVVMLGVVIPAIGFFYVMTLVLRLFGVTITRRFDQH